MLNGHVQRSIGLPFARTEPIVPRAVEHQVMIHVSLANPYVPGDEGSSFCCWAEYRARLLDPCATTRLLMPS